MAREIIVSLLIVSAAMCASFPSYAADDAPKDDNFVTSTINAVFDKLNQYSSGEKGILIKDYDKPEGGSKDYTTDALGRKIAAPTIRTVPAKKAEPSGTGEEPKT